MKRLLLVAALAVTHSAFAAPAAVAPAPTATEASALTNDDSKVAYSLGFVFGKNNAAAIENLDIEKFVAGFKDGYGAKQGLLSEDEIKQLLVDFTKIDHNKDNIKKYLDFLCFYGFDILLMQCLDLLFA